ncbi:MAG TPA: ribonuclease III domain-containing protein [Desulfobacteria bacterium]|nr:ribonuclease III domain-containing protein [Desulfobacteria bacterium]
MDARETNALALAYLGDAVYELEVRKYLLNQGLTKVKELHQTAIKLVKATTQANAIHRMLPQLNEEEVGIVKRGRNAKSGTTPKHTEVIDYRYATAFESLIGFWYMNGNMTRIAWAFDIARAVVEEREATALT